MIEMICDQCHIVMYERYPDGGEYRTPRLDFCSDYQAARPAADEP